MEINNRELKKILGIDVKEKIIKGIVADIKQVEDQYLFIARKGNNYNGLLDISQAIALGAIVVHNEAKEIQGYFIEDLDAKIMLLLKLFYKHITYSFKLIGVCGTNGKSSVVSFLYDMLYDKERMKIGTHFIQSRKRTFENYNTTPDIITLMHMFHIALEDKVEYIIMEVSSHAIDLERIALLRFDYIIYTNIERDHLDYHQTLLHYRYTKYKLMNYLKDKGIVIANKDELYFQELKKLCHYPLISYGFDSAHFEICDVEMNMEGSTFYVNRYFFRTYLLSDLNVYNLTACISLLRLLSISYHSIYKRILMLQSRDGRLEVVYQKEYTIIVDYAHSAKAFYRVLSFLSSLDYHKLIVVVGCGGEREVEKRAEIGQYATHFCDVCIFSEDNSRNEKIESIFDDMCAQVKKEVIKIEDREEAIKYAIKISEKNDIILVSGKGNEDFLIKEGKQIPFNDKKIIKKILE